MAVPSRRTPTGSACWAATCRASRTAAGSVTTSSTSSCRRSRALPQSGIVPALAAGDGVNTNDHAFGTTFPYVALPNTAAVNTAQ